MVEGGPQGREMGSAMTLRSWPKNRYGWCPRQRDEQPVVSRRGFWTSSRREELGRGAWIGPELPEQPSRPSRQSTVLLPGPAVLAPDLAKLLLPAPATAQLLFQGPSVLRDTSRNLPTWLCVPGNPAPVSKACQLSNFKPLWSNLRDAPLPPSLSCRQRGHNWPLFSRSQAAWP